MEVRDSSVARSFGSFVCFRGFPRALPERAAVVNEPLAPGEVVVTSPGTAPPAAVDGHLFTSELGYIDSAGQLHLLPTVEQPTSRCA